MSIDLSRRGAGALVLATMLFFLAAPVSATTGKRVAPRFPPLERSEVEAIMDAARPELQTCIDASLRRGATTVRARLSLVRWQGPTVRLEIRAPGRDPVAEACIETLLRPRLSSHLAERYAWHPVSMTLRLRAAPDEAAAAAARAAIRRAVPTLRACVTAPVDLRIQLSDLGVTVTGEVAGRACLEDAVRAALSDIDPATGAIALRLRPRGRR